VKAGSGNVDKESINAAAAMSDKDGSMPIKNGSVPVTMNLEALTNLMPKLPVKDGSVPVTMNMEALTNLLTNFSVKRVEDLIKTKADKSDQSKFNLPFKDGAVPVVMNMQALSDIMPTLPNPDETIKINTKLDALTGSDTMLPVRDGAVPVTIKSDALANLMPKLDVDKEVTAELTRDFKENIGSQFKQLMSEVTAQMKSQMPVNNNQELISLMQDFVRGQRQMISTSGKLLQVAQN
jgi:hypothetical protein